MTIPSKCNCDTVYCEHRWPFRRDESALQGTLWVLFSRFKWWRWWRGGIWQRFNLGTPTKPYLVWMEMEHTLDEAVDLEYYRLDKDSLGPRMQKQAALNEKETQ